MTNATFFDVRTALQVDLSFPLEEPVLVFTIAIIAFLVGPLLIKRLGQPGIVGIVLLGVAVGPGALGIVAHIDAIELLGTVGLIYLLFTVGLELDLQGFKEAPEDAALFGLVSYGIPFVLGTVLVMLVIPYEETFLAALLLAAVFSSHTLLAYPIVNRLNVTKNKAVTAVFGGILFTDTLALLVLAIVTGTVADGFSVVLVPAVLGSLLALFAVIWFLVPPVSRSFFKNLSEESYFEFLFVLSVIFVAASLAEVFGLEAILGAFVAGLALNQLVPTGGTLMNRIEFVGNAIFIPFFLFHVGMLVDPTVIVDGPTTLLIALLVIVVMFVTKYLAAVVVATLQGYKGTERGVIFGLSTGQAAAALAITLVGESAGVFDPYGTETLNAVVLLLLVTAVVSPWLTERSATKLALDRDIVAEQRDVLDPNILLPLSHHAELQERLLELALVIKGEGGSNPVHVLTVVQPDASQTTDQQIAETREELDALAEYGAAAEVPIETEARVNLNVPSGIVQTAVEVQANQIIVGWDANRSFGHRLFGTIIDQILERTNLPVLVSRLGHPINTTKQIYVVVPFGVDHHSGFYEAVHNIKRLAANLGVPMHVMIVDGNPDQFERLFELVEVDANATYERLHGWDTVVPELTERTEPDDLIVTISPRPGDVGWHRELEDLPQTIVELPPASFLMFHPRQGEPEYDRQYLRFE